MSLRRLTITNSEGLTNFVLPPDYTNYYGVAACWTGGSVTNSLLADPLPAIMAEPADNPDLGVSTVGDVYEGILNRTPPGALFSRYPEYLSYAYGPSALSDTAVVGSGDILVNWYNSWDYDYGSPYYGTASTYMNYFVEDASGGISWTEGGAQTLETFGADAFYYSYDGPFDMEGEYQQFFPYLVNNTNMMIGTYADYDTPDGESDLGDYDAAVDLGYSVYDGTDYTPLDIIPTSINDAASIVGTDPETGLGMVYSTGQVLPNTPVKINNNDNGTGYGQILDSAGWLWTYDPTIAQYQPQNVADYVSDGSQWSGVNVPNVPGAINDKGEFLGIGTYGGTDPSNLLEPLAVIDANNKPLTYVRFGLWDNAFDSSTPANVLNSAASCFIDNDSRRFYLQVVDRKAVGDSTRVQTVKANWFTRLPNGKKDDDGNLQNQQPAGLDTITLTETGAGTGTFVSEALMLVADDVDNQVQIETVPDIRLAANALTPYEATGTTTLGTFTSAHAGNAKVGDPDHRLRRAALGDTVGFTYPAGSNQTTLLPIFNQSTAAGASDMIKTLTVQYVNLKGGFYKFREPVSNNFVQHIEASVKAHLAIAGIKVNFKYTYPAFDGGLSPDILYVNPKDPNNPAKNVDLSAVIPNYGNVGSNLANLAKLVKSHYQGVDSHTVFLIQFQGFALNDYQSAIGGEAFSPGRLLFDADPANNAIPDAPEIANCSFIDWTVAGSSNDTYFTPSETTCVPPHELIHQLYGQTETDVHPANHYDGPQLWQNLMQAGAIDPASGSVNLNKRLWDDPGHSALGHDYQIDYIRGSPLLQ